MYLNHLNEKEKFHFIDLAHKIVAYDSTENDKGEIILGEYCRELGFPKETFETDHKAMNKNIDSLFKCFKRKEAQRVIFLELIGLFLIDNYYSDYEKEIVGKMQKLYDIDDKMTKEYIKVAKAFIKVYVSGEQLIHG